MCANQRADTWVRPYRIAVGCKAILRGEETPGQEPGSTAIKKEVRAHLTSSQ